MSIICLTPMRNAAADLPLFFASLQNVADGLIALDDGSIDDTAAFVEQQPITLKLLKNPVRQSFVGWDDLANRRRLLEAAADFKPSWILWLDADEIIEPSDALVLRTFFEDVAIPGVAYSVEVLRMIDDLLHYDKRALWVNRLYRYKPGLTLGGTNLHFDLKPEQFLSTRRTTIRVLHRASLTEGHRQRRFDKYKECDPTNKYQPSYENLRDPPGNVRLVEPRKSDAPFLLD